MRWSQSWMAGLALLAGCSGLVGPDESRLQPGGGATMDGGRDTGPRRDTGPGPDPDGAVDRDGSPLPPPPTPVPPPPPRDAGPDSDPGDTGPRDTGPTDTGPRPCPMPCDDRVACTVDSCRDGTCVFVADGTRCADGEVCSPSDGCLARRCETNDECQDGDFCNGQESCSPTAPGTGCVPGARETCDDGVLCTADRCEADGCVNEPDDASCDDAIDCTNDLCTPGAPGSGREGCTFLPDSTRCEGNFCDGLACIAAVGCRPSMAPDCLDGNVCTADVCDRVTESCVSAPIDGDDDGHAPLTVGGTTCAGGDDCNDDNPNVFLGAPEICGNGVDENCDGIDTVCTGTGGETCATAVRIELDGTGHATLTGSTMAARHDHRSSCSASGTMAPDVVYSIELRGRHDVMVDTVGSGFDTVLSVATSCTGGSGGIPQYRVCDDDIRSSSGTASRVWLRDMGSDLFNETLYIFVDGYQTDNSGPYTLNVAVGPPTSSGVCGPSSTMPPSFDVTAGGTLYGEVQFRGGTQGGSCGGGGGALSPTEDLLRLRAEDGGGASLRLNRVDTVATGTATLYAREGAACTSTTEVGCATTDGRMVEMSFDATSGEGYWVIVDTSPGRYTLDVTPP